MFYLWHLSLRDTTVVSAPEIQLDNLNNAEASRWHLLPSASFVLSSLFFISLLSVSSVLAEIFICPLIICQVMMFFQSTIFVPTFIEDCYPLSWMFILKWGSCDPKYHWCSCRLKWSWKVQRWWLVLALWLIRLHMKININCTLKTSWKL